MSLEFSTPTVMRIFDNLCKAVASRGRGISMTRLGDAYSLAQLLDAEEPDARRIGELTTRLGLESEDLGDQGRKP